MSQNKINVICVLGGPGAGKTTLCSTLCNKVPNSMSLKAGSLLRMALNKNTMSDAKVIGSIMDKGGLVEDQVVSKTINQEILLQTSTANIHSIILDGFPRTVTQLNSLDNNIHLAGVLVLEAPELVLEKRCKIRNLKTDRIDDLHKPVTERVHDFHKHIGPIVAKLEKNNIQHVKINTCGSIEDTIQHAVNFALKLQLN